MFLGDRRERPEFLIDDRHAGTDVVPRHVEDPVVDGKFHRPIVGLPDLRHDLRHRVEVVEHVVSHGETEQLVARRVVPLSIRD